MKTILLLLAIIVCGSAFSQPKQSADFILFKKHNLTIGSYHIGDNIPFTNPSGAFIDAKITDIKHDSLFLRQFIVQQVYTTMGFYVLDTVGSYRYTYHYKDLKAIGRVGPKFDVSGGGATLIGGGLLLAVASGVVFLADRQKFSPGLLIGSLGLAGIGYVMTKVGGKGMIIGKKYKLVYVEVADNKKM